jgi:hypothetical protein
MAVSAEAAFFNRVRGILLVGSRSLGGSVHCILCFCYTLGELKDNNICSELEEDFDELR